MTREEAEKTCTYWGINEPETMHATSPDEAIADYLAECDELPATILLCGYVRMKVGGIDTERVLESVLETLDEEYGNPDGDVPEAPTDAMIAAAKAFEAVVLAEYKPWACEAVYHEDVHVAAWMAARGAQKP
jgi:hypothetical protein